MRNTDCREREIAFAKPIDLGEISFTKSVGVKHCIKFHSVSLQPQMPVNSR